MKGLSDQRRLYALSALLLVLTVALCCVWGLWGAPSDTTAAPVATPTAAETTIAPEETPSAEPDVGTVSAVLYYQDNYGYLVPVMRKLGDEPGIAKAAVSKLIQSPENDREAARLGLRTVIPAGTTVDLDINKGTARIDLGKNAATLPDAAAEANMVSAIVQTLTEFPTVDTVRFLIAGQEVEALAHGTSLEGDFTRGRVNLESGEIAPDEAGTVTLYFIGDSQSLLVPVTRMVYGAADIDAAMVELAKGPDEECPLESALPSGCGLISVTNEDGRVKVNFTREFLTLTESTDGGRQALRALALTCAQFDGVKSVEIYVEGEPYDVGTQAVAIPSFVNVEDTVIDPFLQTQADAILDME